MAIKDKKTILTGSYIESGYESIPAVRLTDEEYTRALQSIVVACVDLIPVNIERKTFYLIRRKAKPMQGWWFLGGRMMSNEIKEEAMIRALKRETGLSIDKDRLTLQAFFDYLWKDRQQSPQNIGCHMAAYTFTAELSDDELKNAARNLDKDEYEAGEFVEFDRSKMIKENVYPTIIDLYDHIFPKSS